MNVCCKHILKYSLCHIFKFIYVVKRKFAFPSYNKNVISSYFMNAEFKNHVLKANYII